MMNELFYNRATCRLCLSHDLELAMSLVPMPVGDKYLPPERREETRETIPLDLYLCTVCGHLQTGAVVNPEVIYKHYLSRPAAVNPVLSDAYQIYAENILSQVRPVQESLMVEIGSNDGAFLNFFKSHGMSVLGVDPADNLAEAATKSGFETFPTFFTSEIAQNIRKERGPASVVIANFTYANIDDLNDVTQGILELLSPDGIFMFETNYRVDVFQKYLIETINHEHLSYFSVKSLKVFFSRHGMELIDVEHVPSKGGSIRCSVQLSGGKRAVSPTVETHIALEDSLDIYSIDFYTPCASHIHSIRDELLEVLGDIKAEGRTVAGYGTSIGATVFIYQLCLGEIIKFLVDDDPYRQNLVSPGYHIPVLASQAIYDQKADCVLILAPLYAERIMGKNRAYTDQGGQFITIWPKIEIK